MVSSAGTGSESTNGISVTHGSTGRLIPGGRSQRRSNYKVAVTLMDQLVILTVNRASVLRELGDWKAQRMNLWATPRPDQNQAVFLE